MKDKKYNKQQKQQERRGKKSKRLPLTEGSGNLWSQPYVSHRREEDHVMSIPFMLVPFLTISICFIFSKIQYEKSFFLAEFLMTR